MPVNPLAAAALVAVCFAIPFGVAALFDSGPEQTPVAVSQPAVERLDDAPETVRIATLAPAPRLPALREPAAAPATTPADTADTAADESPSATPAPAAAPAPAPAPAPSSGGGSSGGGSSGGGGGSGSSGGGSDSFDSTR